MRLIRTTGESGEAEIEVNGERLLVADFFSYGDRPATPGQLEGARLDYDPDIPVLAWEDIFAGNPSCQQRLEHRGGWSYLGYGRIVSLMPTVVDFGVCWLVVNEIGTSDARCIGEYVFVRIGRLLVRRAA